MGKELAIGYALLGATVICWDIDEETNQQTMNEIKQMGKDSVYAYRLANNLCFFLQIFIIQQNLNNLFTH